MRASALVAMILVTASCAELDWFIEQGVGQAEVLAAARSAKRVRQRPDTPAEIKRRLLLVEAAKQFAKNDIGLTVGHQYRSVTFLDAPAVVYVVSACPKTELKSFTWDYPVVGKLPYRGHFDLEDAERLANKMAARGFDVDVRPVTTYSLLGFLPDPIVSPMLLGRSELSVVETVIHELSHATVFASGQGAFNEGLATFIGREGRKRFVEKHYGKDSAVYRSMVESDADRDAYIKSLSAMAFELRVLFAQTERLGKDEVLARRDAIFRSHQAHFRSEVAPNMFSYRLRGIQLPTNNAELSAFGIYTLEQHLYRRAFTGCNEDFGCFIRALKSAAMASDPQEALAKRVTRGRRAPQVLR